MTGEPVTVGVEEEYQLVDPDTRALLAVAPRIVLRAERLDLDVKEELHSSQIEVGTRVCTNLAEVRSEIAAARRSVNVMAEARGARLVAGGTHPFSRWEHQAVTDSPRYEELEESYRQIVRETVIFGSHVHVGIDDPEELIEVMNRARLWIPVLIAVAANSPFWAGADTGYASFRAEIARRWPQSDLPHHFRSRAEYDKLIDDLVTGGSVPDASQIYWDIRPSMRYDTLEFRATDVPPSIDETVMVAGLVRALAVICLDEIKLGTATPMPRPELLQGAKWRAGRDGLSGELIDVRTARAKPAAELVTDLLQYVRPALEHLGDFDEVSFLVADTLRRGNGADRQRAVYDRTGRFEDVVDALAAETCAGVG